MIGTRTNSPGIFGRNKRCVAAVIRDVRDGDDMDGVLARADGLIRLMAAGPGAKRQRVALWQLALAAAALILLGLNVGAVFNSNFPTKPTGSVEEVCRGRGGWVFLKG